MIGATALLLFSCVYDPAYDGAACGRNDKCPPGYNCVAGRCQAGTDEASVDGDDGGDLTPADDDGYDGADQTEDAGDQGPDAADEIADGGDEPRPCGGACTLQGSNDLYCDQTSNTCKQCHLDEHCGDACEVCDPDSPCTNKAGTYCCLPTCVADSACQTLACGNDWVCRITSFGDPIEYDWTSQGSPFCSLSDEPGPVDIWSKCEDGQQLRFYCPFDGLCQSGSCRTNPAVDRFHDCGAIFGCDLTHDICRMHKQDGQSCNFNFDCQSFCCSRDQNAKCIPYDDSACKIFTTQYWDGLSDYTWTANTDNPATRHDLASWTRSDGHEGAHCDHDRECDSGYCRWFASVGDDRCDFQGCVDPSGRDEVRDTYFCPSGFDPPSSYTQSPSVTNANPVPIDSDCP